jgi:hypothetical protein
MDLLTKIRLSIAVLKGGEIMVDVYVALIVKGRRTIDQVPSSLRQQVLDELTALGLDGNGNPIA